MEERFEEGMIKGTINSITLEKTEKILEQMKSCICLIEGNKKGTGFFCKINYRNELIPVMITNYHIIDENFIEKNNKIKIKINENSKLINISIDNIIYSSETNKYDLIIIKLKEESKYKYLELDDNLFDKNSENFYRTEAIYIYCIILWEIKYLFLMDMVLKKIKNTISNIYVILQLVHQEDLN